jgi:hypothetical protein
MQSTPVGMSDDDAFDHFRRKTALILDEHMESVNTLHKEPPTEQQTASQSEQPVAKA